MIAVHITRIDNFDVYGHETTRCADECSTLGTAWHYVNVCAEDVHVGYCYEIHNNGYVVAEIA